MQSYGGWEPETTEALSIDGGSEPLVTGQVVLGKYRITGRLGAGGMAEVYEATHLQLGSRVALKLPLGRAGSSKGAKMAARLLREAQVGASLDPERVVRVFDVGTLEDGTPIIVLERLDGESMAERLARVERVPVGTALGWMREACAGLSEAHKKGIVHRDVKPSNLFLETKRDHGERLRILDFGIASIRRAAEGAADNAALTDSRGAIGSPPYMSPEQIRDSDAVDARTDVWALGVTLFELVGGRRPFVGVGSALVASIVSDPIPKLSSLGVEADPRLEGLIGSCLERDPSRRPKDAAELGEKLDALAVGAPISDLVRSPRRVTGRVTGRVTRRRAQAALAVIAMAGVIGFLVWKSNASPPRNAIADDARASDAPAPRANVAETARPSATAASIPAPPATATASASAVPAPIDSVALATKSRAGSPPHERAVPAESSAKVTSPPAPPTIASARSLLDDRQF